MTAEEVSELVAKELASITDPEILTSLRRLLVKPICHHRNWDYGKEGEAFPCWLVAEDIGWNSGLVFSEHGFGPAHPWGLVSLSDNWYGMDSGWFERLVEAFCETEAASRIRIWEVVKNEEIIKTGMILDEAFAERDKLNAGNKKGPFRLGQRKWNV